MHLQAVLDSRALKPFTKALTCVSKYGDEMVIHASKSGLDLTSINQAKSAFCSFSYRRGFFQKYALDEGHGSRSHRRGRVSDNYDASLRCQLQTRSLLAILKHRNNEKGVERCELTIIDGAETPEDEVRENEDSLESRLIVRLHCRLGVVKTHRLLLNTPSHDEAPAIFNDLYESRILVQAHVIKEMIEHFPNTKSAKTDPELVWTFTDEDVKINNVDKGDKGRSQIVSELTLSGGEFDRYDISLSPVTIAFFLREFYATVLLAATLNTTLELRFTENEKPVYINVETDDCAMLFIIATNHVRESVDLPKPQQVRRTQPRPSSGRTAGVAAAAKRGAEDGVPQPRGSIRPRLDTQPVGSLGRQTVGDGSAARTMMSFSAMMDHNDDMGMANHDYGQPDANQNQHAPHPLFLASQLSAKDIAVLDEAGLGVEGMTEEDLAQMLDGDDLEEEPKDAAPRHCTERTNNASMTLDESIPQSPELDELEFDSMGPTQRGSMASEKSFRPLFDD